MTTETYWKVLIFDDGVLRSMTGDTWEIGVWQDCDEAPVLWKRGFHAGRRIPDALHLARGTRGDVLVLAEVEVAGSQITDRGGTTIAARRMRVLRAWRWTERDSVLLAVAAAEMVLPLWQARYPDDNRPLKALAVASAWLKAPATLNYDAKFAACNAYHVASAGAAARTGIAARFAKKAAEWAFWSATESSRTSAWFASPARWAIDADATIAPVPGARVGIDRWCQSHLAQLEGLT